MSPPRRVDPEEAAEFVRLGLLEGSHVFVYPPGVGSSGPGIAAVVVLSERVPKVVALNADGHRFAGELLGFRGCRESMVSFVAVRGQWVAPWDRVAFFDVLLQRLGGAAAPRASELH